MILGQPKQWDGDDIYGLMCALLVLLVVVLIVTNLFMNHVVKSYYLDGEISTTCIKANVSWDHDTTVYCSDDINKVLTNLDLANKSLRK